MRQDDTDILVAGGGIAGLAATALFAAEGFRVTCVDPAPPPSTVEDPGSDLRSTAFLMPSVRLLEAAGLWERLVPQATPLRIMRIVDTGGPEAERRETIDFAADEIGEAAFGYNIPNWLLRREMSEALRAMPGAELRFGVSVAHLTPRMREALVRLSDGAGLRARLVIAADGRDSSLRDMLGLGCRRWGYGQKALVFGVSHDLPHDNVSTEIHRSGGPFTLVPLPDIDGRPHSAVVWMEHGPAAAALMKLPDDEFEAALNARACGVLGSLRLEGPRRLWPIIAQVASRLDGPRTALVAEAAHVVPPIGAQGLNMSLKDLAVLAELCAGARAAGEDFGAGDLLRQYHRRRHPEILARIAGIDALNRAAMQDAQGLRDLRLAGLRTIAGLRPLRRVAIELGLGARRGTGPSVPA